MSDIEQCDIAVAVAMDKELIHLVRMASSVDRIEFGDWTFLRLNLHGIDVVALKTGMGLINAAAGTEILIQRYQPTTLLNYGCSGAHRRDIMPGDVVIGERVVHHSAMTVRRDGSEVYKGFGYEVAGEQMDAAELEADPALLAIAQSVAGTIQLEPWPPELDWPKSEPYRTPVVHSGAIASADIWTQWTARLDVLFERHGTLCEDMEAAAIAQIAAFHGVPFLSVKDISNNEYHKASDLDEFSDFPELEIGKRAAAVIAKIIPQVESHG